MSIFDMTVLINTYKQFLKFYQNFILFMILVWRMDGITYTTN